MMDAVKKLETIDNPAFFLLCHNGIRLFQIFKMSDVLNWEIELDKEIKSGLILELTFNKENPKNAINLSRFISGKPAHFYQVDLQGGDVYFSNFDSPVDYMNLYEVIDWIVTYVYQLPNNSKKFEWGIMRF